MGSLPCISFHQLVLNWYLHQTESHHKVLTTRVTNRTHRSRPGFTWSGSPTHFTPIYNTSILVTKKPVSGIIFFGHFLVRLSGNERSLVVSMGSFCWARSNYGYEILTQKSVIFEVTIFKMV